MKTTKKKLFYIYLVRGRKNDFLAQGKVGRSHPVQHVTSEHTPTQHLYYIFCAQLLLQSNLDAYTRPAELKLLSDAAKEVKKKGEVDVIAFSN